MNFYTDDSPGLKISPVSAERLLVGCIIQRICRLGRGAGGRRERGRQSNAVVAARGGGGALRQHEPLSDPHFPLDRAHTRATTQVVVIVMSLGFIFFVTLLHIVGKVKRCVLFWCVLMCCAR